MPPSTGGRDLTKRTKASCGPHGSVIPRECEAWHTRVRVLGRAHRPRLQSGQLSDGQRGARALLSLTASLSARPSSRHCLLCEEPGQSSRPLPAHWHHYRQQAEERHRRGRWLAQQAQEGSQARPRPCLLQATPRARVCPAATSRQLPVLRGDQVCVLMGRWTPVGRTRQASGEAHLSLVGRGGTCSGGLAVTGPQGLQGLSCQRSTLGPVHAHSPGPSSESSAQMLSHEARQEAEGSREEEDTDGTWDGPRGFRACACVPQASGWH